MDLGLAGRRCAVAAATRGLGYAAAAALAAEGARVALCGRRPDTTAQAAARLDATPVVADVSTPEGAAAFVRAAAEALGGVDVLVTNAGGPPPGGPDDVTVEQYAQAFSLNALSVVAMCGEALPGMRARRWGRIVAITSIAVRQPMPDLVLSNTARAAATGYLKTLARRVAGEGVTVNSVQPGLHATERLRELHGGDLAGAAASVPAGVVGDPADLGAVVAFLCSDAARFVTGVALPVDGGAYAGLL